MIIFWLTLFFLSEFILYLIIFDVILSWLTLLWLNFRPKFLSDIIDPIYNFINKIIPTTIWSFRFDAFIAIILIYVFQFLLINIIPWLYLEINKITSLAW